jgi:hypothetical protein
MEAAPKMLDFPRLYVPPPPAPRGRPGDVPAPVAGWVKLNGGLFKVAYWGADEWAGLPHDDRPELAIVATDGGRFAIIPVENHPTR